MPDEITITPKSESPAHIEIQNGKRHLISFIALGLGVSFFLPWAHFLGSSLSGYDLQTMGHEQRLLWLIPIFSVFTILAGIAKTGQPFVSFVTGLLPFCALGYWLKQLGNDLTPMMVYGAYLTLVLGLLLMLLSFKWD